MTVEQIPHRCPVCEGKGLVPDWFYLVQIGGTPISSGVGNVPCRSCQGTGIVWSTIETNTEIKPY